MHCSTHTPWYNNPNNMQWGIQIIKIFIVQLSPPSCSYTHILTQSIMFTNTLSLCSFRDWQTEFHNHIQQHIKYYIFREEEERQKIWNWITASTPWWFKSSGMFRLVDLIVPNDSEDHSASTFWAKKSKESSCAGQYGYITQVWIIGVGCKAMQVEVLCTGHSCR